MALTTIDIPITHNASYVVRSNLIRIANRAVDAPDATQKAYLVTYLTQVHNWINFGLQWRAIVVGTDTGSHKSRGLHKQFAQLHSNSLANSTVKTEALNMITVVKNYINTN